MDSKFGGTNFKQTTTKLSPYEKAKLKAKLAKEKKKARELLRKEKKRENRGNNTKLLKKQLDKVFSIYIRQRDIIKGSYGKIKCPCCGQLVQWKDAQNMHYVGRSNMNTRYDEENCYAGCMRCNVMLNGNYPAFTDYLINKNGAEWLQKLIAKGREIKQWTAQELKDLIKYYKEKVSCG